MNDLPSPPKSSPPSSQVSAIKDDTDASTPSDLFNVLSKVECPELPRFLSLSDDEQRKLNDLCIDGDDRANELSCMDVDIAMSTEDSYVSEKVISGDEKRNRDLETVSNQQVSSPTDLARSKLSSLSHHREEILNPSPPFPSNSLSSSPQRPFRLLEDDFSPESILHKVGRENNRTHTTIATSLSSSFPEQQSKPPPSSSPMFQKPMNETQKNAVIYHLFDLIDQNNDGTLLLSDFIKISTNVQSKVSKQLQKLLKLPDHLINRKDQARNYLVNLLQSVEIKEARRVSREEFSQYIEEVLQNHQTMIKSSSEDLSFGQTVQKNSKFHQQRPNISIGGNSDKFDHDNDGAGSGNTFMSFSPSDLISVTHDEQTRITTSASTETVVDIHMEQSKSTSVTYSDLPKSKLSLFPSVSYRQFFVKSIVTTHDNAVGGAKGLDGTYYDYDYDYCCFCHDDIFHTVPFLFTVFYVILLFMLCSIFNFKIDPRNGS